jgi:hypothetical protein
VSGKKLAFLIAGLLAVGGLMVAAGNPTTAKADGTLTWTGQGTTNGQLNTVICDSNTPPGSLQWNFTTGGGMVTSATITISGIPSSNNVTNAPMTETGGVFKYVSGWFDPLTTPPLSASVTYVGTVGMGAQLVISHGCPPTAQVRVAKVCVNTPSTTSWTFTISYGMTSTTKTVTCNGAASDWVVVPAGASVTVSENNPPGSPSTTSISCDTSPATTGTTSATFTIAAGQSITCTATNTFNGQVRVAKVCNNTPSTTSWTFTISYGMTSTTKMVSCNGAASDWVVVPAGASVTVTENSPPGSPSTTSISCDTSPATTGTTSATFTIAAGQSITCTATNTFNGQVRVAKVCVNTPTTPPSFTFTISYGMTSTTKTVNCNGDPSDWVVVPAGASVTVTETNIPSGVTTSISCNTSPATTGTTSATFTVAAGQSITCTATNTFAVQACSPGFWRNHTSAWPISTATLFTAYFNLPAGKPTGWTLLNALQQPGTTLNNAAFVGTGALLSALSQQVAYPYTQAQIVAAVNAALAGNPNSVSPTIFDLAATFGPGHVCPLGSDTSS